MDKDQIIDAERVSLSQALYAYRGVLFFAIGLTCGVFLSLSIVEHEITAFFSSEQGVEACRAVLETAK